MSAISVIDERVERERQEGKFLYKIDEFLDTELTLVNNVTATISVWVSACIVIVSSVLYITAFATTGWGIVVTQTGVKWEYGLWKYCGSEGCSSTSDLSGSYICCQIFAVLSLLTLFTGVVILILYCLYDHMKTVKVIRYGVFFTRIASAIFLLITFSVYAGTWYKDRYNPSQDTVTLSYSFALTVTAFSLEFIATILMGIEMRNQALEIEMKEQDRRELAAGNVNRGYDQVNGNSDEAPNMATPYELFQQFAQGEQNNSSQVENYNGYTDINSVKQNAGVRPKTFNSEKPYSNNEFIDSRYRDARPKSHYTVKANPNNESDKQYTDVRPKSGNSVKQRNDKTNSTYYSGSPYTEDIYNEIPIDNIEPKLNSTPMKTISVCADVHTNEPHQPVRPTRKSKKYLSQDSYGQETPVHSYENIPDGQAAPGGNMSEHSRDTSKRKTHSYANYSGRNNNQNPATDNQRTKSLYNKESNAGGYYGSDKHDNNKYDNNRHTLQTEKTVHDSNGYYNTNQDMHLAVPDKHRYRNYDTSKEGNQQSKSRSDPHGYYNVGLNAQDRHKHRQAPDGTHEIGHHQRY